MTTPVAMRAAAAYPSEVIQRGAVARATARVMSTVKAAVRA
jgi:hypothetical protein